jgi:23S rRNA pseudouridine2605 synthase
MAHCGVASRRRAEQIVSSGRVIVDGERVLDPARDVDDRNEVLVDGKPITEEQHEYYVVNKPVGVVSTARDPKGRAKVTDLVESDARLYPVGRLDVDTSGLIVLTNDGELANRLMHPSFEVERAYRAKVKGSVGRAALRLLRSGVDLEDGRTDPAGVKIVGRAPASTVLELAIHEGRKRQVRRMCEAVGHPVLELHRVGFGPLRLGRLRPGQWRRLRPDDVERLKELTSRRQPARRRLRSARIRPGRRESPTAR